jgi:hypothetical protein
MPSLIPLDNFTGAAFIGFVISVAYVYPLYLFAQQLNPIYRLL